ncbi:MAG: FIST C-terminal domain-containing protein [Candidatus Aenigmarchaeota archaeon]|nr:FIST C-terminal domain-containing protein [Candidatus Aenigmarchaeota archaeon]
MKYDKILNALEEIPSGLSISEIAKKTGLHRNTVSSAVKELKDKEILEKRIGSAKIYYLKKYSSLHHERLKGKNIKVGIGISDLQDGYNAAVSAAKQAVMQSSNGKAPTFSIVFVSSRYNNQIKNVVRGINKVIGTDWIGCTTDCELNSTLGFSKGTIEVLSIDSRYLHFSVSVAENYRRDPYKAGEGSIKDAINKSVRGRSLLATAQFMRATKKEFTDIITNQPYFILTFVGGLYFKGKKPVPGLEFEFLEGIKNVVGSFIPIVGASAISDTDKFLVNEGRNYQFANGKIYENAAVVSFVVSELYVSYGLEHGYIPTNRDGRITKVSNNGRILEEINNNTAVDEYCKLVDINKETFTQKSMVYTTMMPISVIDTYGDLYPIASGANPDNKTLFLFNKLFQNELINISQYDEKKAIDAISNALSQATRGHEKDRIAISLIFSCAGRKNLLREKVNNAIEKVKRNYGDVPFFGFYSSGEIGARKNREPKYNNFTVTCLVIFDKLLTE